MPAVTFDEVDIVFGERPQTALPLLDRGMTREEILAETGQVLGVAGCSLTVERGEICVLMGLSGSGKSTLLRAVNRLNSVVRGSVQVEEDGKSVDVATCDARMLRHLRMRRIAMVFQQFALLPWRTVAENVAFGLELRGVPKAERDRIVEEKLALVHLEKWAGKFAHELSGGMQQRVGLARAFATDADILLMDEPFSALDPLIRDKLQDDLLELQERLDKTIIFVSHDLDEALKIGNTVAIMEGGRIIQAGSPEIDRDQPRHRLCAQLRGQRESAQRAQARQPDEAGGGHEAGRRADGAGFADPSHGRARRGGRRGQGRRRGPRTAPGPRLRAVHRRPDALRLAAGGVARGADAPGDRGGAQQRLAGAGRRPVAPAARRRRDRRAARGSPSSPKLNNDFVYRIL